MMNLEPSVFLTEPFARLWAGKDPFSMVEDLRGDVYRALEGRRTLRTVVEGKGYFVKIHRGVGWKEIFKNLASLRLPIVGAHNEFAAIARLTEAGVPTMTAHAYGERGVNPARRHSFIVTAELAPTVSLDVVWTTAKPSLSAKQRRAIVEQVAQMTRSMHAVGLNHRDLYLCHFLLHTDTLEQSPRLSLIDLHRAQIRMRVPRRWRDKDLAALYFSALETGVSLTSQLRFLRRYFADDLHAIFAAEKKLLRHLGQEGERLRARYARKYAPSVAP